MTMKKTALLASIGAATLLSFACASDNAAEKPAEEAAPAAEAAPEAAPAAEEAAPAADGEKAAEGSCGGEKSAEGSCGAAPQG